MWDKALALAILVGIIGVSILARRWFDRKDDKDGE